MRKMIALAALALTTGAGAASPFFKPKVAGNEVSVTVENVQDVQKAYDMAGEFCGRYGKVAKRTGGHGYTYIFDCIAKPQ